MESKNKSSFCEAAILAGGRGTRMGRDKAALVLAGRPLLDYSRAACRDAEIAERIIRKDTVKRCGPIGGIVTAFQQSKADAIVFLSCDMPFVSGELLQRLMKAGNTKNRAIFFEQESRIGFPFLIRRIDLPVAWAQIRNREFSLHRFAEALQAGFLMLPASARWQLSNINTPRELRGASSLHAKHAFEMDQRVPVLAVRNLLVRRGKTAILRNFSWRVGPCEHWVILGSNGSGKTSLLSVLTGYLMPTAGSIELLGQVYGESDWRELRKKVGLVSSSIRQMMAEPETALETVISGKNAMIDLWGTPSRSDIRRAREILAEIECGHLANRPWSVLSQGERQRILIGRALMAAPKVLILDEPCAGLDPVARETFLNFLERLAYAPAGPSLILVTHHVEEITPAFQHALLLLRGERLVAGAIKKTLTSHNLSIAFESEVEISSHRGRYGLVVKGRKNRVL